MSTQLPIRRNAREGYNFLMHDCFASTAERGKRYFIACPFVDAALLQVFADANILQTGLQEFSEIHVMARRDSLASLECWPWSPHAPYAIATYPSDTFHFKVFAQEVQPGVMQLINTSANLTQAHLHKDDAHRNADTWQSFTCSLAGFLDEYWYVQRPRAPRVQCVGDCPAIVKQFCIVVDADRQRKLICDVGFLSGEDRANAISHALTAGIPEHADSKLEALCVAIGLLAKPRSVNVQSNASASTRAATPLPSEQPELRQLVVKLLQSFEAADPRESIPTVCAYLDSLLNSRDISSAARPGEWIAIAKAIGHRSACEPKPAPKRTRGGGSTGQMLEAKRQKKLGDLSLPGSWRACKKCLRGGRYITDVDGPPTQLRKCWVPECPFQTTVRAWQNGAVLAEPHVEQLKLSITEG